MSDYESAPSDASDAASPMMTDPQSVEGLFVAALAKASAEERETFLQEACGDDAERRRRVEALLRAYEDAGSFLEHPPLGTATADSFNLDFLTPSDDPGLLGLLGPYEVYEVLGRGGMGIVFRARDPKLNRVVAIKVLAPELAANPNARRRFLREAQAAAAISHPHVVTIHAVDEGAPASGGRQPPDMSDSSHGPTPHAHPPGGLHPPLALPYLVMECIVGQTLQQKLDKQGSLRLTETLRIGQQLACGLAAAHKQGLIHRDIKPANVLLENGVERVKITDFGLARLVDDVSITRTGEVSGTPQYMSPEQAQGDPVDHRSDLFSLGCVLYAMCTGRSPFRATSLAAVIRRVCDDTPRPIDEINPETPPWLIEIVNALLEKNPDDRPNSAEEVATLLGDRLAGIQRPLTSRKTSPERPAFHTVPEAPPIPSDRRVGKGLVIAGAAFFVFPWLVAAGRTLMRIDDVAVRFGEELFGSSILGLLAMLTGWTVLTAFGRPSRTGSSRSSGTSRHVIGRLLIIGGSLLAGGVIVIFNYVVLRLPYQRPSSGQDFGSTIVLISLVAASLLLIGLFLRRPSTRPARSTVRRRVGRTWNIRRIGRTAIWSGVALIAAPCFPIAFGFLIGNGDPMEFGGLFVFPAAILGVLTIMMGCITLLVAYSASQRHPEGDAGNRPWRDRVHQTTKSPWSVLGWMFVGGLVLIPSCLITGLVWTYSAQSSSQQLAEIARQTNQREMIVIESKDQPTREGAVILKIADAGLSVRIMRTPNYSNFRELIGALNSQHSTSAIVKLPPGEYIAVVTDELAGWQRLTGNTRSPQEPAWNEGPFTVTPGSFVELTIERKRYASLGNFPVFSRSGIATFLWNHKQYDLTRPQAGAVQALLAARAADQPDVSAQRLLDAVRTLPATFNPFGDEDNSDNFGRFGMGSTIGAADDTPHDDDTSQTNLRVLFDDGQHPAWGSLIVPGETEGTYRLAELKTPPVPFNGIWHEQGGSVEPSDEGTADPPVGHDDSESGPASPPAPPLPVDKEDAATVPDEDTPLLEQ